MPQSRGLPGSTKHSGFSRKEGLDNERREALGIAITAGLSAMLLAVLINAGPMRAEQALAVTLQSAAAAAAPASWYNPSWAFRVPISIDNSQGNVALS